MDIEGRLLSAQRRSQMTMKRRTQTVQPAGPLDHLGAIRNHPRASRACLCVCVLFALLASALHAQQTGPQQLVFAGLRTVPSQGLPEGQINGIRSDAQGNLYLLIDQKDGVRILKTDPAAANILAQAQIGAKGDIGLALALDPAGNVYVTGTTTSGALTATAGAAFLTASGTAINSFVAKFDPNLNTFFVTFAGGGSMTAASIAATSDAVFITGSIFTATLPVTPSGIIQTPAFGSNTGNGFVEKFSSTGSTLLYATYLSGANGGTTPAAIVADTSDNAYITGNTSAPGYPTIAAVIPAMLGTTSGFLTKLTPAGDGITFSTYIPGGGITSLAIDPVANNLLLSGSISLGQFPVASVQTPLTATNYQVLLRMTLDGSSVLASTLLAPGTQSFVAAGASGTAWVDGALSLPLLPLTPLANIGNSFAVRVNSANLVDQTARFGGIAATNPNNASAPVNLTSIAVDPSGNALAAGSFAPSTSANLLATQTFDLPLANAPTSAFPSTVHSAVLPPSACNGGLCPGSAAWLAKLTATTSSASAALALSVDDSPNLTLRNLGSAQATGLQIALTGFTSATSCGTTLAAGGECSIALTGIGPGSITVSATNSTPQIQALPALASGLVALPIAVSPKELDFGIVSSASAPTTRTITVTNLTQQSQPFASALNANLKTTLPYTFAEQASDCTLGGVNIKLLAPGGVCHITLGLTASNVATNDGAIQANWLIGTRTVQMTAYAQAAALSLSAAEIDFGTQFPNGPRLPRYLYLSNNSTAAIPHTIVTLPNASPFSLTDNCPSTLEPLTVCQMQFAYQATHTPSADAVTLALDQGLSVLVTGRSQPQPSANGASVNPNLSVSTTSLNFPTAVVVTGVSSNTQTLTIQNTGATAFALSLVLTGDFTDTTNCGATLAGNASCSVLFSFAPSQPGTRQGLLAVTAGAGTTPAYITLSGVGTGILTPANNGTLTFGSVIAGQPSVQWYKISQSFTAFAAATASLTPGTPFTAVLVEDIGYGHGQPPASAFTVNPAGTCVNCWLGLRFTPPTTGPETGFLTLTSAPTGSPYLLSLTGTGLPLTGLVLTPGAQDFGPVPINSASSTALFTLTNLTAAQTFVTLSAPTTTGDFTISNATSGGATCSGTLAYTASCYIEVSFAPSAAGPRTGTLTIQSATAKLTGYGSADPGLSLTPNALIFTNVPGTASTQQIITLTNTSGAAEQIGAPIVTTTSSTATNFGATTNCAALAAGATCTISVTFTPATAPSAGTLAIPVTSSVGGALVLTTYIVPLTGAYTTEDSGIEILASDAEYGPQSTGASGITRQFTIDNLTQKSLTLNIALPRQFVLSGPPCSGLAPNASCNFSVAFLPLANGDITGTLFAQATPTDGSATLNGLGYVEGYGIGAGTLSVTGTLLPAGVLDFGQVPSGQSTLKTLTLTNTSLTLPLTIRRITSEWPFLATSTCGATLAPGLSCAVLLTYTPLNQVATGASSPPALTNIGTLVVESDAASSPDLIDLTGTATPIALGAPSNIPPLSAFVASQSSLTFATTMAGDISAPQTVTLDNTGTATIHIIGLQTTPDFTIASTCAAILPGASCTLTVTFTPQVGIAATRVSAIEISSDASTPLEFISLIGAASPSTITLSPASLTFGTVLVGVTATLPLQISNTGATPVIFATLSATGDYTAAAGSCPLPGLALAPGTTCTAQITFTPTQSGTRTGTLSVATSASTLPLTVALTGGAVQSHLQISPPSLSFGPIAVGAPATLSLTLANTGTAPITNVSTAIAPSSDYAVTVPCAVATLPVGGSCSVTVTFTPAAIGARPGSLTVTSSDSSSPTAVPLTGTGVVNGTFTLTTSGGASASASVASGTPATYNLTVTPVNNFSGTVVLTCAPIVAAQYASCSLLPSTITLSGAAQNSAATLNTVTSSAANTIPAAPGRSFYDTALCLLFPAFLFTWRARTSRHRAWRRFGPMAWAFLATVALLTSSGCGGKSAAPPAVTNSNLLYTPPGTYQYQVTASSVSGATQITQTVTLNLTIQ
jgi:trimeric autotransporter adhesin